MQRVAQAEGALVLEQCPNCATNDPFIESNSNGIIMKWFYEYNLKDHLGNTRVTFKDKDNNWTIDPNTEISQINHYYPFGLNMEGNWNGAQGSNKYQYNGKEWNDDLGLGWNDYGARFYDPTIGRWLSPDPLAEKFLNWSPYNYGVNNPINVIDPNGMESEWITGGIRLTGQDAIDAVKKMQQDSQNNPSVGEAAAAKAENNGRPVKSGTYIGCYPYVWAVLQEAYKEVDGTVPSALESSFKPKTDFFEDGSSAEREYPTATTPFANLFASKVGMQDKTPDNLKGTGVAGAMELAGLGNIVDAWSGLKKGAVIQFWKNSQERTKAKNGELAYGHSAIFLGYSSLNGERTIIYADQWGKHAINEKGQVYNQTNYKSQLGYVAATNHSYSEVIGANIKSSK